jgi:hypothetical protein
LNVRTHEAAVPQHLVSQAQRGDHDAFSALITERISRLYGVAGLITVRHLNVSGTV